MSERSKRYLSGLIRSLSANRYHNMFVASKSLASSNKDFMEVTKYFMNPEALLGEVREFIKHVNDVSEFFWRMPTYARIYAARPPVSVDTLCLERGLWPNFGTGYWRIVQIYADSAMFEMPPPGEWVHCQKVECYEDDEEGCLLKSETDELWIRIGEDHYDVDEYAKFFLVIGWHKHYPPPPDKDDELDS